ncbi:MAG: hypothetical protein Q9220_007014 [cf. Caloplaca sp. 1 TL-2023]
MEGLSKIGSGLLHRRVYAAQAYPKSASDGSTVVLLGNQTGVQIWWWGHGVSKLQDGHLQSDVNANGGDDLSMDNDNNDGHADNVILQHRSIRPDAGSGSHDAAILSEPRARSLSLNLGTGVLRIAVPSLHPKSPQLSNHAHPLLLANKLVAALICSDSSVRLLTLPLRPPSIAQKERGDSTSTNCTEDGRVGSFGEQVVVLSSDYGHKSIPKCVSLTTILSSSGSNIISKTEEGDYQSAKKWSILVASASSDLSGLLLIHRIPLASTGTELDLSTAPDSSIPWSTRHLPSPAVSLQFNPLLPQSMGHSTLLTAEGRGPVRLLYLPSTEIASQCSWTVSLFPNFPSSENTRTLVLDARWVLGGKAVLVLSAYGEWGIWALEGPDFKQESGSHKSRARKLGALSAFTISGRVDASPDPFTVNVRDRNANGRGSTVKLAPTTPSTRRARQENLFAGSSEPQKRPPRGGISIDPWQNADSVDEAVLLWHNDSAIIISSLLTHWGHKVRASGNLFGAGVEGKGQIISSISLEGTRLQMETHQRMQNIFEVCESPRAVVALLESSPEN